MEQQPTGHPEIVPSQDRHSVSRPILIGGIVIFLLAINAVFVIYYLKLQNQLKTPSGLPPTSQSQKVSVKDSFIGQQTDTVTRGKIGSIQGDTLVMEQLPEMPLQDVALTQTAYYFCQGSTIAGPGGEGLARAGMLIDTSKLEIDETAKPPAGAKDIEWFKKNVAAGDVVEAIYAMKDNQKQLVQVSLIRDTCP